MSRRKKQRPRTAVWYAVRPKMFGKQFEHVSNTEVYEKNRRLLTELNHLVPDFITAISDTYGRRGRRGCDSLNIRVKLARGVRIRDVRDMADLIVMLL